MVLPAAAQPRGVAREVERGPEQPRLRVGLRRQLLAADPAREAEVVADEGAGPRLAAEGVLLDDEGGEPLRGAVDRGREARGTGADYHEVEGPLLGPDVHPERYVPGEGVDYLGVRGIGERVPVEDHHYG